MYLTEALVILAILLFTLMSTKRFKNSKPPLPPGPRGLPLVGNLLSLELDLHTQFTSLARTYGPILTLWLGKKVCVVVSSPSLAREVLKDKDTTFANRDVPVAAKEATYGGLDIVWLPYGSDWRMLRKVCMREMLNNATLDSVYTLRRREIRKTMGYLYERVGTPTNIGEQLFMTLLNVITNMLWGGTVKGQDRLTLGAEFRQVVVEMTELLGKPNLSDFYPWLARLDLQGIEKKMKGLTKRLDRIFEMMIDERLEMKMDGHDEQIKDLLQVLLQLKNEGDARNPLTMTHLKALLMDMVVGGTDTTASAIEMALAEMINKPEVMNKVQQEVDMVVGKNGIVEEYHLSKVPYLYAVMKEVLRLHPAVPLLVPRCPSKTCIVGGYTIPKGARVLINAWAIHRDPSIWVNPLEFIPERFMDSNYKLDFTGNDFRYFPFGSGRRICAGTAMAERMFLLSLAALVHFFDWKLPEGEKLDLSEKFGIVLKKKIPLVVVPTPRLSNPALYEALYE